MSKKSVSEYDILVAQNIRMARAQSGMSQEKLGEILGVTFQQVQKYEKGSNRVTVGRLVEIAFALGVTPMTLMHGIESVGDATKSAQPITTLSTKGVKAAKKFDAIPSNKVRGKVYSLLGALAATDEQDEADADDDSADVKSVA